jgi:hypothetical protein
LEYDAPGSEYLRFCSVNGAPAVEEMEERKADRRRFRVSGGKRLPVAQTGFVYEDYVLNPVVCCSAGSASWQELVKIFVKEHVGDVTPAKTLPESLARLAHNSDSTRKNLEDVFYWVRDTIKYGSFDANHKDLNSPERLNSIVEGGVGDCKDKAFLLKQVCQYLGIESYYIIVNLERGLVVEELPSNQFDHVFLAAVCDGEILYLDATSPMNVFGLPNVVCQNMKALSERGGCRPIVTIPVDDSSVNRVEIIETFRRIDNDRLMGDFRMRSFGRSAREIDESRKAVSLIYGDRMHSMSHALPKYLPGALVDREQVTSGTSNSSCFQVNGGHRRCRLYTLANQVIGRLVWDDPAIPLHDWRALHATRFVGFQRATVLDVECAFVGEVFERLESISAPPDFSNDICEVRGEIKRNDDSLVYSLEVTIPDMFVPTEKQGLVPEAMETINKAFRVPFSLRRR